jgi:hypothetical protein
MIYNSDLLLASIKTRAMIPSSQNTFMDSDLLNLANEEMETFIVGTLSRVQEEYLVVTDAVPLVAGQTRYRIPVRAIGQKLRDIYIDTGSAKIMLPRLNREDIPTYNYSLSQTNVGFYLEGNYIVLIVAAASTTGNLMVSYLIRPGQIVDSTNWQKATAVNTSTNVITVATILPTFIVGTQLDIITAKSGSETILRDTVITAIDSVNKLITVDQPCTLVSVGDYVCLSGQSAVPQCPEEMHPLLAQRVVCRVLESLNDAQGLQQANATLQLMERNILALIDSRVTGKPIKLKNSNNLIRAAIRSNSRYSR